jgi:hypothetical protein
MAQVGKGQAFLNGSKQTSNCTVKAGKAGAGKSTLTKLIFTSPKTKELLRKRENGQNLLFLQFKFLDFWRKHSTLSRGPLKNFALPNSRRNSSLGFRGFPSQNRLFHNVRQFYWLEPWSWSELVDAFNICVKEISEHGAGGFARVVLFIDWLG